MTNSNHAKFRDPANDRDWQGLCVHWQPRADTIYLNHGSFGLAPNRVRYGRRQWIDRLDEQPMDFYLRQLEPALEAARAKTADFVGTSKDNLVFSNNATYGMNVVARSFPLAEGDEVLLSNHEYGAVFRIWDRECQRSGANTVRVDLPLRFDAEDEVVAALIKGVTPKTKLFITSHITSATALILPIKKICAAFRERGIAVCVDGPHAPAQVEFSIDELDCDFYTASCHKWLCATLGSGFLYANPRQHKNMEPAIKSWGRLLPAVPEKWDEEFTWLGTRDPSPFLSIVDAIDFMSEIGTDAFRGRSRWLAAYAEDALVELFGTQPMGNRSGGWYGSMAHVPLPPGDWSQLQKQLWEQVGIEVMVVIFEEQQFLRVSCHLYNNQVQLNTLVKALHRLTK